MPYFRGGVELPGPRFLQALDSVDDAGELGWIAECPICRGLLLVEPVQGMWTFSCDEDCDHDAICAWLDIKDLRIDPGYDDRLYMTMMLAKTPEVWKALMQGDPVDPAVLDQEYLRRYQELGVWES